MQLLNQQSLKVRSRLPSSLNSHSPLNPHYLKLHCHLSTENGPGVTSGGLTAEPYAFAAFSVLTVLPSPEHFHYQLTCAFNSPAPLCADAVRFCFPSSLNVSTLRDSCQLSWVTFMCEGREGAEFSLCFSAPHLWSSILIPNVITRLWGR